MSLLRPVRVHLWIRPTALRVLRPSIGSVLHEYVPRSRRHSSSTKLHFNLALVVHNDRRFSEACSFSHFACKRAECCLFRCKPCRQTSFLVFEVVRNTPPANPRSSNTLDVGPEVAQRFVEHLASSRCVWPYLYI